MILKLLILLSLAVLVRSDLRARDPGLEEEPEEELLKRGDWHPQHHFGVQPETHGFVTPGEPPAESAPELAPPTGETATQQLTTRTGNWCAFVHSRMVTTVVSCGTEQYTIRSQKPCPYGTPDCQLVMYKLSLRPVYREKQKVFTALQWKCCPGHTGAHCEETVAASSYVSVPIQQGAGSREQESHQSPGPDPGKVMRTAGEERGLQNDIQHTGSLLQDLHSLLGENRTFGLDLNQNRTDSADPLSLLAQLLLPHLEVLVKEHVQRAWDGFNKSLQSVSREVGGLAREVEVLRSEPGRGEEGRQHVESKLQENVYKLDQLGALLSSQGWELQDKLHSQQAAFHYNLTAIKTETDVKVKRNQKMIQVKLQALNSSLAEVKREQERLGEELHRQRQSRREEGEEEGGGVGGQSGLGGVEPSVWEAIRRLEHKVLENSRNVTYLAEENDFSAQNIQDLQRGFRNLESALQETAREIRVLFMESGLTVEDSKVEVLQGVRGLAANLSALESQLRNICAKVEEFSLDIDDLYGLYPSHCNCQSLAAELALLGDELREELRNCTRVTENNRHKLEDASHGAWRPGLTSSVEDLIMGLQQVQRSLAFEQEKHSALQLNVSQVQEAGLGLQREVSRLRDREGHWTTEIQRLSSSFQSLLGDVVRHAEVLEALLGADVLEFTSEMSSQLGELSVPALEESVRETLTRLRAHNSSLVSLERRVEGLLLNLGRERSKQAAPPLSTSEGPPSGDSRAVERRSGDLRLLEPPMGELHRELSALEGMLKALGGQVRRLEKQQQPCPQSCCNCTAVPPGGWTEELQKLRQDLESHVQVFHRVFRDAEALAASNVTVDLSRLWRATRKMERRRQKGREKGSEGGKTSRSGAAVKHNTKDTWLEAYVPLDPPIVFLASTLKVSNQSGTVVFERAVLNTRQGYSPETGVFIAPAHGLYLFTLSLDFRPGPALGQLMRGEVLVARLHQNHRKPVGPLTRVCLLELTQGEQVRLELLQGSLERGSQADNTFGGVLLFRTP
ncbi:multimerin-2-like [Polyodon spathula]|uniref:multimerin-2-like n=1 Tax=Polyodon spathula TaxID=7913 RepID=UPI001B7E2B37|nr:multimerin-2-like [Polyodon spathula]